MKHKPFQLDNQPTLFQGGCAKCSLFTACGGGRTAPCGCIYGSNEPMYRQCEKCTYICRERYAKLADGSVDTLQRRLAALRYLQDVKLRQQFQPLPVFIPAKTYELMRGVQLDIEWVNIDLKKIPVSRFSSTQNPKHCWYSRHNLENCLRVNPKTRFLATLNGSDDRLEKLWGSNHFQLYDMMTACSVNVVTAPTFSVYEIDRKTQYYIPESERVINIMRHHTILDEMSTYFELPIPNLYWRDERDIDSWVDWLNKQSEIHCVSRDLTCRSQNALFLQQLFDLIKRVNRPMHILFMGIGVKSAADVIYKFAKIGCTVSIITSDPIIKAMKGGKELMFNGIDAPKVVSSIIEHKQLALRNLMSTMEYFQRITESLKMGQPALQTSH